MTILVAILTSFLASTNAQFNLYHTNWIGKSALYHDCLQYRAIMVAEIDERENKFPNPYQIISYCLRPLVEGEWQDPTIIQNNIISTSTFDELKMQNISGQDLLSWSAPVDLVESYESYLLGSKTIAASERFYNCTSLWFGTHCQFTFNSSQLFSDIVEDTFIAKDIDKGQISSLVITNLTCYVHLKCNRGPSPMCLDWREVCDGRTDCLGDGADEMHCLELEVNECEEGEYRCHNGMCVPEEFVNDHPFNPDCLDQTDENGFDYLKLKRVFGFYNCYQNPTFQCEESDHFFGVRGFVCGDGQHIKMRAASSVDFETSEYLYCKNSRDVIMYESILSDRHRFPYLTTECLTVVRCLMFDKDGTHCLEHICTSEIRPCSLSLHKVCNHSNYVVFPVLPFLHDYAEFGFWTNTTITYDSSGKIPLPDFLCYNEKRCPFFSPRFQINNMTCLHLKDIGAANFNYLIKIFHACLLVDTSGNKTDCIHPSLFHCPKTTKCISKYRLLDGVIDCYDAADELYADSCKLNDKYRFRCLSENKCIAPVLMHDTNNHCTGGEDERFNSRQKFSFQNLCNGYLQLTSEIIDEQKETDETNCEQWPCNNQYTRCNGAWECSNGADEVDCNRESPCYPGHHPCVSPISFQVMCLPIEQAGDGSIDCLGSTDEREYCRYRQTEESLVRYRCWNSTRCTSGGCLGSLFCPFEESHSIYDMCNNDKNMENTLNSLILDSFMGNSKIQKDAHFILGDMSRFQSNVLNVDLTVTDYSILTRTEHISTIHTTFSFEILPREIDFRQAWICNRGILIFHGQEGTELCLCPPSYYGDRCQFQNQRVSLTLQFNKECAPICRGVYGIIVMLIDDANMIHSHEQFTYTSTSNCDIKYNIYLLFQSQLKNLTKNYTIRIDAYNKIDLLYYTSWTLPVKFLFLPVNRIAAYLIIPSHPVNSEDNCGVTCNNHGRCVKYWNTKEDFCLCDSGWSGTNCSTRLNTCDCSSDAICLGRTNNRSICLCSQAKSGPRCFLSSACRNSPCKNGGQCVAENEQISTSTFTCICTAGYSGPMCDINDTRIDISFHGVDIPRSLLIHFITVQHNDHPLTTTISKKIPFDDDSTTLYISTPFNLIFVQVINEYFLAFLQTNTSSLTRIPLEMNSFHHCPPIHRVLDERTLAFHILRRAKFYHNICKQHSDLSCFYDKEAFMCLCNNDNFTNCFPFDFNKTSICQGRTTCRNDGQCFQDRATCPSSTMCICTECFYGGKCQLTTKGFSLSLDVILGYHIRSHLSIIQQPPPVKVSVIIATLMLLVGLVNGFLSIITFQSKKLRQTGCGFYLLASSLISFFCSIIFTLKFWFLLLSHISWTESRIFLLTHCILMDFILQSLLTASNWLNACVAIERVFIVIKGISFDKKYSQKAAQWITSSVVLCSLVSFVHDPIHRELIDDDEEQRTWCAVRYSSVMRIFDLSMNIFHFIIPFSINLVSAIIIIITISRTHSTVHKKLTYRQHLRKQLYEQKHLIISPIVLVVLSVPRLIISFLSGCMKSARNPWLFLFGYFISFVPPLLTFVIFVWPSEIYKKEILTIMKRRWTLPC